MKRFFALLIGILVLAGCKKSEPELGTGSVNGDWELVSTDTKSVIIGTEKVSVYISFSDGNFVLYQQFGDTRPRKYIGTYAIADGILGGKYSDGRNLGSKWAVSIDKDMMQLVSESGEIDSYKRCTIPSDITDKAY